MTELTPDQAGAREDLCRFLSACYYEPAAEFSEEHLFDSIVGAAERLSPALAGQARQLRDAFAAQDLQSLLIDHASLFIGPGQPLAAPYGSRWCAQGDATVEDPLAALLDSYEQGGFELGDDFHDLPDHVAVELEFLYLLCFTQNQAEMAGDEVAAEAAGQLRQDFLARHLGAWVQPFAAAVQTKAETAFYRELAGITAAFVQWLVRSDKAA